MWLVFRFYCFLKINLLFNFEDGRGRGLKNWSFFVNILNGWPLLVKLHNSLISLKEKKFFYQNKRKIGLYKIKISQYIFTLELFTPSIYKFQGCFNKSKCLARNHQFWTGQRKLLQSTLKLVENFCLFQLLASVTTRTLWSWACKSLQLCVNNILLVERIAPQFSFNYIL